MILSTDSTANLPVEYYKNLNISMIPMQIFLDGQIYDDLSENLPIKKFYASMRSGSSPKTAQINAETARTYFENLLASGEDVLHISFSSALSGNTSTMCRLADEINQNRENKLIVYDSHNASLGEGFLVLKALELKNQNISINEIVQELDKLKDHACSYFTIDQLKYLVRGGRIGKLSGIVGSLLNIKPILHVDLEGNLVSYKKVMSRKKAIQELAEICAKEITDKSNIYITHADSIDEAKVLASKVKELTGTEPIITDLTQVIGCHTGPGLLSIFFIGTNK